jgi:hypothetical protein
MARYVKQYDPSETYRRLGVEIREAHCPGLLEYMSSLPVGVEGPAMRAVFYQWFLENEQKGTLVEALEGGVNGPGGLANSRTLEQKNNTPRVPAAKRVSPPVKSTRRSMASVPTASPLETPNQAIVPRGDALPPQPVVAGLNASETSEVPTTPAIGVARENAEGLSATLPTEPGPLPLLATEPTIIPAPSAVPGQVKSLANAPPDTGSATGDYEPVDVSKLSKIEFDALMNLETMFNAG